MFLGIDRKKWLEHWTEITSWLVLIVVVAVLRFSPEKLLNSDTAYIYTGGVISFALLYYWLVYRYFSKTQRLWIKNVADVVLIGVLIILARGYGVYLFTLYFIPIMAAGLYLNLFNSLIIALAACVFVAVEIILKSQEFLPSPGQIYFGAWQIALIILVALFCRFLALQLASEKEGRIKAETQAKLLGEERKREREFVTLTSHQLNTPVSIIRGYLSLLVKDKTLQVSAKQRSFIERAYQGAVRMSHLVREILTISRIGRAGFILQKEEFDWEKFISEIVEDIKAQNPDLNIIIKGDKIGKILADSNYCRQVLYNLLDNAIKYGGGTIEVESHVKLINRQNFVVVAVADQGKGVEGAQVERLFQPFVRGKNILELDKEGTGLGLYIARLIIEAHGGRIWHEPNKPKGSIFKFTLPLS
jgi:signal transduction histidine kinase